MTAKKGDLKAVVASMIADEKDGFLRENVEYKGHTFEVREPDEATRQKIFTKSIRAINKEREAKGKGATPEELEALDIEQEVRFRVWAMVACTYDPETGERVFSDAQVDELTKLPAGVFDPLKQAAVKMANPDRDKLGKGSSTTAAGGTASN